MFFYSDLDFGTKIKLGPSGFIRIVSRHRLDRGWCRLSHHPLVNMIEYYDDAMMVGCMLPDVHALAAL